MGKNSVHGSSPEWVGSDRTLSHGGSLSTLMVSTWTSPPARRLQPVNTIRGPVLRVVTGRIASFKMLPARSDRSTRMPPAGRYFRGGGWRDESARRREPNWRRPSGRGTSTVPRPTDRLSWMSSWPSPGTTASMRSGCYRRRARRPRCACAECLAVMAPKYAAFDRNGWPRSVGLSGRFPSESVAALPRIPLLC
jgi:hypothetical protein